VASDGHLGVAEVLDRYTQVRGREYGVFNNDACFDWMRLKGPGMVGGPTSWATKIPAWRSSGVCSPELVQSGR
jgi:hypothetical protein